MKRLYVSAILIALSSYYHSESTQINPEKYELTTLYGSTIITEPVLIELIHSQAMTRLKQINQYGTMHFVKPSKKYTRYDHSLGVLFLLRHYGAPIEEQVAGLIHDISHTVFSHVTDYLFGTVCRKESYQDLIFEQFVSKTDILDILKKYGLEWICPLEARAKFTMLKDDLPNLCADRLEYNLYGGYVEDWLRKDDVVNILSHITYDGKKWMFDDAQSAKLFATVSINLSKEIWCSAWNGFLFTQSANALKRAIYLNIITIEDLMYSIDNDVWQRLNASTDPVLVEILEQIKHFDKHFEPSSKENHNLFIKGKFRGVDPLISTEYGAKALSQLDPSFKDYLEEAKTTLNRGWYIRYW